jgi:lipoprotein NlpI
MLSGFLSGCAANTQTHPGNAQMGNLLLAEPAPMSSRSQMAIVRYNQVLVQASLKDEERAQLFHQRGMHYDNLGLSGLAQFDFSQALQLKPDMAEAYNSIGVHYTQQMNFAQAYEAFDATLDINPDYDYAFLNRGIALYYGGRPDLAVHDFEAFYSKDESDPYRALWSFIAAREVDLTKALAELHESRKHLDENNWATNLVDLYLGQINENELKNALIKGVTSHEELTNRLCEAYFYLGKYHSAKGNRGVASNYFKLALSSNVFEYVEHRYARLELNLLRDKVNSSAGTEAVTQ